MGISNFMYQQLKDRTGHAIVVDVGCSNGAALKLCKEQLCSRDIDICTVGIDSSQSVSNKARCNLDCFISKKTEDVDKCIGEADFVICVNVINRLHYCKDKEVIFRKAAEFLKDEGLLITDASGISEESRNGLEKQEGYARVQLSKCPVKKLAGMIIAGKPNVYKKSKK